MSAFDPKRTCSALGIGQLEQSIPCASDVDQRDIMAATDLSRATVYRALGR
jgi:hypothetical protein